MIKHISINLFEENPIASSPSELLGKVFSGNPQSTNFNHVGYFGTYLQAEK
jgi:hypothetical protein